MQRISEKLRTKRLLVDMNLRRHGDLGSWARSKQSQSWYVESRSDDK